ncbi:MAG: hypothetical protein RLZZ114_1096 [Bacteroidota bacterium]
MPNCERIVDERNTALRGAKNPPKTPKKDAKSVDKSSIWLHKLAQTANKSDTIVHKSHTTVNKAHTSAHFPTTPSQIEALDSLDDERVGRVCMILDECDIWRSAGLNFALYRKLPQAVCICRV